METEEKRAELYCTFCNDNQLSCGACDDSYEGN